MSTANSYPFYRGGGGGSSPPPVRRRSRDDAFFYAQRISRRWTSFLSLAFLTMMATLIVGGIFSAKFSRILKNDRTELAMLSEQSTNTDAMMKRINDIQVATWFFATVPILNVGLVSGLAVNVGKLERDIRETSQPRER